MADEIVVPGAAQEQTPHRSTIDIWPKLGQWFWVTYTDDRWDGKETKTKTYTELMCATHIGSNMIEFEICNENWTSSVRMHNRDVLANTRLEPNWKAILLKRIDEKQIELQKAILLLADTCHNAGIVSVDHTAESSLLPAVVRESPEQSKKQLQKLKKTTFPKSKENVENIMKEMVGLQKSMFLAERAKMNKLTSSLTEVDERLFALELYAGIGEGIKTLVEGPPAPETTQITVRQMLRYMDEETLFDLDTGGMDYKKIGDFDEWIIKPENLNRVLPEPKGMTAFRVRRNEKEYPVPSTIHGLLQLMDDHNANKWTYLLIRNGGCVYRLYVDVDFSPRLLPLREEFNKPLMTEKSHFSQSTPPKVVTPDDLEFDKYANERRVTMRHYNRILFLLQGLLDRSKVFSPHPPINLGDMDQAQHWFNPIHDEEDGLPSANPPKWEEYRDAMNAKIKVGHFVYSWAAHQGKHGYHQNTRPYVAEVTSIRKNRKQVRVSWPWGTRYGRRDPKNWRDEGPWGDWPVNKLRHQWIPMDEVFNVVDYTLGDYKPFLCDAYLKGAYLKWAPALLSAEHWHQEKAREKVKKPQTTEGDQKSDCAT